MIEEKQQDLQIELSSFERQMKTVRVIIWCQRKMSSLLPLLLVVSRSCSRPRIFIISKVMQDRHCAYIDIHREKKPRKKERHTHTHAHAYSEQKKLDSCSYDDIHTLVYFVVLYLLWSPLSHSFIQLLYTYVQVQRLAYTFEWMTQDRFHVCSSIVTCCRANRWALVLSLSLSRFFS